MLLIIYYSLFCVLFFVFAYMKGHNNENYAILVLAMEFVDVYF